MANERSGFLKQLRLLYDAYSIRKQGLQAINNKQQKRFAQMVNFARAHSPYYRELYHGLPDQIEDPTSLPTTSKSKLMAQFNKWVTDSDVTIEKVRAYVADPNKIGDYFLEKYTVATTSGTTGNQGIFLIDMSSFSVVNALAFRMLWDWLNVGNIIGIVAGRGRLAMVNAMGGHFASAIAATRLQRSHNKRFLVVPVHTPIPEMVSKLNGFRPVILAPYASIGAILASEQEHKRLHINPELVVLSAEGLPGHEYSRIAKAFHAKVRYSYAATECPFISYSCEYDWLHVNSDYLLLEPVDADYKPVPPGKQSHTVLLSNLANRIQPFLRYDLGDSILQRPDPCPCGNPLPAIRVQGRAADMLSFFSNGEKISIPPLVFIALASRISGIELFQLVQTRLSNLRVRLKLVSGADSDRVWHKILTEMDNVLKEHKLDHVTVEQAEELPQQTSGGKYRGVIPFKDEDKD